MRPELLALHAQLLEVKPEGVEHDEASCPFCAMAEEVEAPNHIAPGGEVSDTFTQEQVDAAIADAIAPLQDRVGELQKAAQETEVGKAVSEASAALQEQIDALQAQVDEATVRATAAEQAKTEVETFWAEAIQAETDKAERESRKTERIEKAKAAGVLTEDYITANADRFAEWTDDEFAARLDEWSQVASLAKGEGGEIPGSTGFQAAREIASAASTGSNLSLMRELRQGRQDPRSL